MALLWHIRIFIEPITAHFSVVPFPIFTFTVALQYVALQYVSAIGIELSFRKFCHTCAWGYTYTCTSYEGLDLTKQISRKVFHPIHTLSPYSRRRYHGGLYFLKKFTILI